MSSNCRTTFPNPHAKCVRDLLNRLIISDNEFQCANLELENIQKDFKQLIDNAIFPYSEFKKLECASEERMDNFQKNVENINHIKESFNKNLQQLQFKCKQILDDSKKLLEEYNKEKKSLEQFNYQTINYLKCLAIQNNDPKIIKKIEKDVNEMNQDFAKEILYINKCETVLSPFLHLLDEKRKFIHWNEPEWQPKGKSLETVDSIAREIKDRMGITLRKAFAHLHIYQPIDKETFLVQYLLKEERNEEIIKEKLERFTNK